MKYGYRVVIHKNVPGELLPAAKAECDRFVGLACRGNVFWHEPTSRWMKNSESYGSGYRVSHYRRNHVGHLFANRLLSFRRLSKNRRIFGVVPVEMIRSREGGPVDVSKCSCPDCLYSLNGLVRMIEPYCDEDYFLFCEVGEIKG